MLFECFEQLAVIFRLERGGDRLEKKDGIEAPFTVVMAESPDQFLFSVGFTDQDPFWIIEFVRHLPQLGGEFEAFRLQKIILQVLEKNGERFVRWSQAQAWRIVP